MTAKALIDLVLLYTDQVPPTDATYTTRRARILQWLQEVFNDVWHYHDWSFALVNSSATAITTALRYALLPSDYGRLPANGGVYWLQDNTGQGLRLQEKPPIEVRELLEDPTNNASDPSMYALYGIYVTSGADQGKRQLWINPGTRTVYIRINYIPIPPTLVDASDGTSNLWYIPPEYHNTVLLAGTIAKDKKAKGDFADWHKRYMDGLAQMVNRETPLKSETGRMPMAVPGMF